MSLVTNPQSKSTKTAAIKWQNGFENWAKENGIPLSSPPDPMISVWFIASQVEAGYDRFNRRTGRIEHHAYSETTVNQCQWGLKIYFKQKWGIDLGTYTPFLNAVANIRREHATGRLVAHASKADMLSKSDIIKLATPIPCNEIQPKITSTRVLMMRAYVSLAMQIGNRISELANLQMQNISVHDDYVEVFITKSKTDQEGKGRVVRAFKFDEEQMREFGHMDIMFLCPVKCVKAWIDEVEYYDVVNKHTGTKSFFRQIRKNGEITKSAISTRKLSDNIFNLCRYAGLDSRRITGHSFRIFKVVTAREGGAVNDDIQAVTGHKDARMLNEYNLTKFRQEQQRRAHLAALRGLQ